MPANSAWKASSPSARTRAISRDARCTGSKQRTRKHLRQSGKLKRTGADGRNGTGVRVGNAGPLSRLFRCTSPVKAKPRCTSFGGRELLTEKPPHFIHGNGEPRKLTESRRSQRSFLAGPSPQHPHDQQVNRDANRERDQNKPFHFLHFSTRNWPTTFDTRTANEK